MARDNARAWFDRFIASSSEEEDIIVPRPLWKLGYMVVEKIPSWVIPDIMPIFGWIAAFVLSITVVVMVLLPRFLRLLLSGLLVWLFPIPSIWLAVVGIIDVITVYGLFSKDKQMTAGDGMHTLINVGKSWIWFTITIFLTSFFNFSGATRCGVTGAYALYLITKTSPTIKEHSSDSPIYGFIRVLVIFGSAMIAIAFATAGAGVIPRYDVIQQCGLFGSVDPEVYAGCVLSVTYNNSLEIQKTVGILRFDQYSLKIQDLWNATADKRPQLSPKSAWLPTYDEVMLQVITVVGLKWDAYVILRPIVWILSKLLGGWIISLVFCGLIVRPLVRRIRGQEMGAFAGAKLRNPIKEVFDPAFWQVMLFSSFWDVPMYITAGVCISICVLIANQATLTIVAVTGGFLLGILSFTNILHMARLVELGKKADKDLMRDGAAFTNLEMKEFGDKMRSTLVAGNIAIVLMSIFGGEATVPVLLGLVSVLSQLQALTKPMTSQVRSQLAVSCILGFAPILGLTSWVIIPGLMVWFVYLESTQFVDFLSTDPMELPVRGGDNIAV